MDGEQTPEAIELPPGFEERLRSADRTAGQWRLRDPRAQAVWSRMLPGRRVIAMASHHSDYLVLLDLDSGEVSARRTARDSFR